MNSALREISRTASPWRAGRGPAEAPRLTATASPVPDQTPDLITPADRRAAAARIIRTNPSLSDRAIARCTGLAAGTVASIRSRTSGAATPATRVGWDGRVRPMNSAEGRITASRLLMANPDAPIRQIAEEAGISITTARDVRLRIRAGQHPVPPQQRGTQLASAPSAKPQPPKPTEDATRPGTPDAADVATVLSALRRDPTLRYSDSGRMFLHWLNNRVITDTQWQQALADVPPHCLEALARVARQCAECWAAFADEIDFTG